MNESTKLPPELQAKLATLLREIDGEYEIVDMKAMVEFIVENATAHPALLNLININEDAVVAHYEKTGEVPPGIKMVRTTTQQDSNVVGLEVLRGPIPPKQ